MDWPALKDSHEYECDAPENHQSNYNLDSITEPVPREYAEVEQEDGDLGEDKNGKVK